VRAPHPPKASGSTGARWLIGIVLAIEVVGVVVGAWFYSETRNTLLRNGRWASTKERLEMQVMAARAYLTDRHALAFGHLDLGAWHGYQEVLWRDRVTPRRIAFDFLLNPASYLVFVFGHDGKTFSGLRISAHGQFESQYLTGTSTGRFTSVRRIPLPQIDKGDWIRLEASFEGEEVHVSLNGEPLPPHTFERTPTGHFGFRCGMKAVLVDDVELELQDGRVVHETFTNVRDLRTALLVGLGGVLLLDLLVFGFVRFSPALRRNWKKLAVSTVVGLALVVGASFFVRERFSRRYAAPDTRKEKAWRASHTQDVVEEIEREHAEPPEHDVTRVLVIGTSQTWGSGARRRSEGMVPTLQRLLNANEEDPRVWRCINGGVSSSRSYLLLRIYRQRWLELEPNAVVINLSNNDAGRPRKFEESLEAFARLNRRLGIPTLFVLEATSIERRMNGLALHAVMKKVAKEFDIDVIDMHAWMKEHSRHGFLWWDTIHPTSFGHRLIAQRLVDDVRALVER